MIVYCDRGVAAAAGYRGGRRPPSGLPLQGFTPTAFRWCADWCRRPAAIRSPAPFQPGCSLGAALLTPTRIYVKGVLKAMRDTRAIKGLAHITGGGLTENLPRVLPAAVAAHIDLEAWQMPAVFGWLQDAGKLDDAEMLRTFNCGIGMVAVVPQSQIAAVMAALTAAGKAPC